MTPFTPVDYLEFLDKDYLAGYVSRGGAAVKLLATGSTAEPMAAGLATIGDGFLHVAVDAARTKVHLVDQVFTEVARQVDWVGLARRVTRAAYRQVDFPALDDDLTVAAVAGQHEMDLAELYRSVRRHLERAILDDVTLAHEFRIAMLRLCQAELGRGDVDATERDAVLGWLRGEKIEAAKLRAVSLYAKVARHNARPLLVSLTRWVRRAGLPGVIIQLDLDRLAVSRRPPAGLRDGIYYSKAAVLDVYEMLRQLIDSTDELEGALVAVLLPPELVTDEIRGISAYGALHLRVVDEVRDRRTSNPYAALVRIGTQQEVIR